MLFATSVFNRLHTESLLHPDGSAAGDRRHHLRLHILVRLHTGGGGSSHSERFTQHHAAEKKCDELQQENQKKQLLMAARNMLRQGGEDKRAQYRPESFICLV